MSSTSGNRDHQAQRLRVLLLADTSQGHAATLLEHIASLVRLSSHDVRVLNPRGIASLRTLRLAEYDVVVIHYSLMVLSEHYLSPWFVEQIAGYDGVKVQFIQDDYRHVDEMRRMMRNLGIRLLFTLVPEREVERVWPADELPGVRKVTTLAGFVPSAAHRFRTPAMASRPLDVGYRGRALPPWLGILGQEKAWIAEGFLARTGTNGLRCDISWTENARIYGDEWYRFVSSCRVTLGTESGSTITDFDGSIERRARRFLADNPHADFWDVHNAVLAPFEGNVRMNVISPRLFEAASLRTGLVLFPGEYSGVLERDRHYIPLEKDFSNADDVVAAIRDSRELEEMIERTHVEIVESGLYSFGRMVETFDQLLDEMAEPAPRRPPTRVDWARAEERVIRIGAGPKRSLSTVARLAAGARLVAADATTLRLVGCYASSRKLRRAVRRQAFWSDVVRLAMIRRANAGRLTAGPDFVVEEEPGRAARIFVSRPPDSGDGRVVSPSTGNGSLIWKHDMISDTFTVPVTPFRWVSLPVVPSGGTPIYEFVTVRALQSHAPALIDEAIAGLERAKHDRRSIPAQAPRHLPFGLDMARHGILYTRKARMALGILRSNEALRLPLLRVLGSARLRRRVAPRALVADLVFLELLRRAREGQIPGIAYVEAELLPDRTLQFESRAESGRPRASSSSEEPRQELIAGISWDNSEVGLIIEVERSGRRIPFGFLPDGKRRFAALEKMLELEPSLALRAIASCSRLAETSLQPAKGRRS